MLAREDRSGAAPPFWPLIIFPNEAMRFPISSGLDVSLSALLLTLPSLPHICETMGLFRMSLRFACPLERLCAMFCTIGFDARDWNRFPKFGWPCGWP